MRDFFEEMRREEAEACWREYRRAVDADKFDDTDQTYEAFVHGWYGTFKFKRAKRELTETGSTGYMGGMLLSMLSLSVLFITGFGVYMHMPMAWPAWKLIAFFIAPTGGLACFLFKRSRRKASEGAEKFSAEWRKEGA